MGSGSRGCNGGRRMGPTRRTASRSWTPSVHLLSTTRPLLRRVERAYPRGDKQGKSRHGAQSAARRVLPPLPHCTPPWRPTGGGRRLSPLSPQQRLRCLPRHCSSRSTVLLSLSLLSLPLSRRLSALFDERAEPPLSSPTPLRLSSSLHLSCPHACYAGVCDVRVFESNTTPTQSAPHLPGNRDDQVPGRCRLRCRQRSVCVMTETLHARAVSAESSERRADFTSWHCTRPCTD